MCRHTHTLTCPGGSAFSRAKAAAVFSHVATLAGECVKSTCCNLFSRAAEPWNQSVVPGACAPPSGQDAGGWELKAESCGCLPGCLTASLPLPALHHTSRQQVPTSTWNKLDLHCKTKLGLIGPTQVVRVRITKDFFSLGLVLTLIKKATESKFLKETDLWYAAWFPFCRSL